MAHLIDKDALVAEIERLVNNQDSALDYEAALEDVRNFIDNLEVKEVDLDLEKECKNYLENNFNSVEEPDEFFTTVMQLDDMVLFARHFFELGLKAQKGEKV